MNITTNILATIVVILTTNVTTFDNAKRDHFSMLCPDGRSGCLTDHSHWGNVIEPATEKTETTTIIEERRLQAEVEGRQINALLSTREVSRKVKVYKLEQNWKLIPEAEAGKYSTIFDAPKNLAWTNDMLIYSP